MTILRLYTGVDKTEELIYLSTNIDDITINKEHFNVNFEALL
jgi:hypothetical protein